MTGQVRNDSGGIPDAEIVLASGTLRARTGPTGTFRLERVPIGEQQLLIRAIGYLPRLIAIRVNQGVRELETVTLERAATLLPEITATAKIRAPAFSLTFPDNLDQYCRGCEREGSYALTGASMSDDGIMILVPIVPTSRKRKPYVGFRMYPVVGEWGPYVYGMIMCRHPSTPIATRIDDPSIRVLHVTGEVWVDRKPGHWTGFNCIQGRRLDFKGDTAIGAAPLRAGWVITVLHRETGALRIRAFSDFGVERWAMPVDAVFDDPASSGQQVLLAPTLRGVTVALTTTPFSWAEIDSTGSVVLRSSPLINRTGIEALGKEVAGGWHAQAVFPIRDGFVQTFESADRSRNIFVVYDRIGRPTKVLSSPWASGLLASHPTGRMVLAYRYLGHGRRRDARLLRFRF